jgi:hypothetical protein
MIPHYGKYEFSTRIDLQWIHQMKKLLLFPLLLLGLGGCDTIKMIKGNKPLCPSYKYSHFMGKTKDFVMAAKIPDNYIFIGDGIDAGARNDTRVAFYIENSIISGIGCY